MPQNQEFIEKTVKFVEKWIFKWEKKHSVNGRDISLMHESCHAMSSWKIFIEKPCESFHLDSISIRCRQNHRTLKGASPSLELVKICEVVRTRGSLGPVEMNGEDWLWEALRLLGSQPRKPHSVSPLSGLSKPSHHTQLFTVKHTDHYEQARNRQRITMNVAANQYSSVHLKKWITEWKQSFLCALCGMFSPQDDMYCLLVCT